MHKRENKHTQTSALDMDVDNSGAFASPFDVVSRGTAKVHDLAAEAAGTAVGAVNALSEGMLVTLLRTLRQEIENSSDANSDCVSLHLDSSQVRQELFGLQEAIASKLGPV